MNIIYLNPNEITASIIDVETALDYGCDEETAKGFKNPTWVRYELKGGAYHRQVKTTFGGRTKEDLSLIMSRAQQLKKIEGAIWGACVKEAWSEFKAGTLTIEIAHSDRMIPSSKLIHFRIKRGELKSALLFTNDFKEIVSINKRLDALNKKIKKTIQEDAHDFIFNERSTLRAS